MNHQSFHDYCKEQVLRLAGRVGWVNPRDNPAPAKDLIDTLEFRVSRGSREFARRVIDICVEARPDRDGIVRCPTVGDLVRIAAELREREVSDRRRTDGTIVSAYGFAGCEACNYSGWVSVERGGYDYAAPCACRMKVSA